MATYPSAPPPDTLRFLEDVSIFEGLDTRVLTEIEKCMEWRLVHGGGVLFRSGDIGDALYMVVSGRLRVILEEPGRVRGARTVREVTRGDTVGELALVTGDPRSASVVALRDTELGRLSRDAFTSLIQKEPQAIFGLTRRLAQWLVQANQPSTSESGTPSTITLVPMGEDVPLPEFAATLAEALGQLGQTLRLNARMLDENLGAGMGQVAEGDEAYPGLTRWLNDQENTYQFIIYEADPDLTPWTLRCLSQADRILQVAIRRGPFEPDRMFGPRGSAAMIGGAADQELVILQIDPVPSETEQLLALGEFTTHHHIRIGHLRDYARLARHLAGRAIALVLGGGGARGFAHIGVIRALEEAGIPIDRLGGTSMGAVIAAQYAGGLTPYEMLDLNRRGWIGFRPHKDYTIPMISLLSGRAAGRMLKMMFGDRQMEDLWLNCFCVSTNLSRAELMVHRSGPVRRWLRASISIPGSAPPVIGHHGDLLVDGGVLDNVPVASMRELGKSSIIAVDVSPNIDLVVDETMKLAPSPWELLRNRVRPTADGRRFPSLFQILYRTSVLASIRAGKEGRGEVALYLAPPTGGFDTFAMHDIDAIVEMGYRYAVEQLRNWKPS
jgi:NTE family protein/lysophospholipid hydrolase